MADHFEFEREVAELLVEALNLEDVNAKDIDPEEPLFRDGLGLDSIDALEISLAISEKYGVKLRSDDENNKDIFSNLRCLSAYITDQRRRQSNSLQRRIS